MPFVFRSACGLVCLLTLFQAGARGQYFPVLRGQYLLGTQGEDKPVRMVQLQGGKFLLAGTTTMHDSGTKGLLVSVDSNGKELRQQMIGQVGATLQDVAVVDSTLYFSGSSPGHGKEADYWAGQITLHNGMPTAPDWQALLGGSEADHAFAVAVARYGGCLVAGSAWSTEGDVADAAPDTTQKLNNAYLALLDKRGKLLRSRVLGGSGNDWVTTAASSAGGGYFLAGATTTPEEPTQTLRNNADLWVARLDAAGNTLWRRTLRQPYEDIPARIIAFADEGCAVAGTTYVEGVGNEFWVVRFNKMGDTLFTRTWGGEGYQTLTGISACSDGGFICTGFSSGGNAQSPYFKGREDLWVMRMNVLGNIIWQQTFGGPDNERGVDVLEWRRGLFYILGQKENHFTEPSRGNDFWLLQVEELPCEAMQPGFTTDNFLHPGKAGSPILFLNRSLYGERWYWRFGDGTSSSEKSPTKTFAQPGRYTITLTAYMNGHCSASFTLPQQFVVE